MNQLAIVLSWAVIIAKAESAMIATIRAKIIFLLGKRTRLKIERKRAPGGVSQARASGQRKNEKAVRNPKIVAQKSG